MNTLQMRRKEAEEKYLTLCQSSNMLDEDLESLGPQQPEKASFLARLKNAKADVNAYMQDNSTRPFHFGTHYSTSAIVLHYLMRLQPFSGHAVLFQGDRFDHADRLFQSVRQSWMSASGGLSSRPATQTSNMQDVKELIPEFYYLPEFLCNMNKYDFGTTPSGVVVDDVELPPWAMGSPTLFIQKHR
jgi:beige protein homolog 1